MKFVTNARLGTVAAWGAAAAIMGMAMASASSTVGPDDMSQVSARSSDSTLSSAESEFAALRTPRCRTSDLSLSLVAETASRHHGGGMNHQGATFRLKNRSGHTCHLYGYPGAAMRTPAGSVIAPGRVVRGSTYYATDPGPRTIVLRPGKSAYGELGWTSADGTLPAAEVGSLIVTPPDERTHRTVTLHTMLGGDRTIKATALTAAPLPLPS